VHAAACILLLYAAVAAAAAAPCSVSGPSPGAVTCLDVDVLLPMKVQDKLLPTLDALLDDKQVGRGLAFAGIGMCRVCILYERRPVACACGALCSL
jgi:hypothetical protein